jgi:hypothetical protein
MYGYQIEYKSGKVWHYLTIEAKCLTHARLLTRGLDVVSIRRVV